MAHKPASRSETPNPRLKGAAAPGFTLMEVLVAVTILGVGFVALFGVLSGSLSTVSRIEDREELVRTAQMKLNEICLSLRQGREPAARSGEFGGKYPLAGRDRRRRRQRGRRAPAGLPACTGSAAGHLAGRPGREPLSARNHDLGPRPTRPMTGGGTRPEKEMSPWERGRPARNLIPANNLPSRANPLQSAPNPPFTGVRFHCATPNAGETPATPRGGPPATLFANGHEAGRICFNGTHSHGTDN